MQKTLVLMAAAALAFVAPPGLAVDAPTYVNDGEQVYVRFEFPNAPDHAGNGGAVTDSCGSADAIAGYVCTTGEHNTAIYAITIGFDIVQPGLTGKLEHVVTSAAGNTRFRCNWNAGSFAGCQILVIGWPGAANRPFHHDLWAYDQILPTPVPSALPPHGIAEIPNSLPTGAPGAVGPWSGYIIHA